MMLSSTPITLDTFRRLPGLFRRWELIEILRSGVHYHLEDAGSMRDGTPLIAVFVCDPTGQDLVSRAPVSSAAGHAACGARP
jgi:hypothetical protein